MIYALHWEKFYYVVEIVDLNRLQYCQMTRGNGILIRLFFIPNEVPMMRYLIVELFKRGSKKYCNTETA